jgi:hypothetical protein
VEDKEYDQSQLYPAAHLTRTSETGTDNFPRLLEIPPSRNISLLSPGRGISSAPHPLGLAAAYLNFKCTRYVNAGIEWTTNTLHEALGDIFIWTPSIW